MAHSRNSKSDKQLQEKLQALLSYLLREEDNKYCADCDAKGPRWASWNLGIFVCIRCAGIHRNLGVHISRVKSVNLDTWTEDQVASVQNMGNSKGRAVYEANLPDNFRRPQNSSALETFIRGKYEHKKYIAQEWVPPSKAQKCDFSVLGEPSPTGRTVEKKLELNAAPIPRPNSSGNLKETPVQAEAPVKAVETLAQTSPSDDLFADFISAPLPATTAPVTQSPNSEEKDFFNQVSAPSDSGLTGAGALGKIDKDSILSLYGKAPTGGFQSQQPGGLLGFPAGGANAQQQLTANNPFLMGGALPSGQSQMNFQTNQMQQFQQQSISQFPPNLPTTNAFNTQQSGTNFNLLNGQLSGLQIGNGTFRQNVPANTMSNESSLSNLNSLWK